VVRFAPDTTLRYQKSAVNSTEKNQLSHGLGAEQLEPPLICSATVKRLMIRDHETNRANEQSALAGLLILITPQPGCNTQILN
jgi:hypothetical protein